MADKIEINIDIEALFTGDDPVTEEEEEEQRREREREKEREKKVKKPEEPEKEEEPEEPESPTPPKKEKPPKPRPPEPVDPPENYGEPTSDGGLISRYGYGYEPRKHYKSKRKKRRILPPTTQAPFVYEPDPTAFGGEAYEAVRGFQKSKVTRRGRVSRKGVISPAFRASQEAQVEYGQLQKEFEERERDEEQAIAQYEKEESDRIREQAKREREQARDEREQLRQEIQKQRADAKRLADENKAKFEAFEEYKGKLEPLFRTNAVLANPHAFVGSNVLNMIRGVGPYGFLAVSALTTLMTVPQTLEGIIKTLSQKGYLLNADWRRAIEDEVNALMSIEDKKKRLMGFDQYVATQTDRYQPESGSTTHNSFENRHEIILSKSTGLAEKAVGVV